MTILNEVLNNLLNSESIINSGGSFKVTLEVITRTGAVLKLYSKKPGWYQKSLVSLECLILKRNQMLDV